MSGLFETRYRVSRDRIFPQSWAAQYRLWWLPIWFEHGNGLLKSEQDAEHLISRLLKVYKRSDPEAQNG